MVYSLNLKKKKKKRHFFQPIKWFHSLFDQKVLRSSLCHMVLMGKRFRKSSAASFLECYWPFEHIGTTGAVVAKNMVFLGDLYMCIDSLLLFLEVFGVVERILRSELWDLSQYLAIDCVTDASTKLLRAQSYQLCACKLKCLPSQPQDSLEVHKKSCLWKALWNNLPSAIQMWDILIPLG